MINSFLTKTEIAQLGLGGYGENVKISRYAQIYNPSSLFLGNSVRIDDFCVISATAEIRIGNHVHIAPFCGLYGGGGIIIGDLSGISSRVALYSISDDFTGFAMVGPMVPANYRFVKKAPIILGKHTVIGTGATLMPGVVAPEGNAVGAHSFVTESFEPWSIYSGIPAVKIGIRNKRMLKLEKLFIKTQ